MSSDAPAPHRVGRAEAVLAVASLAFRESARNRVLHALLAATALVAGISYLIAFVAGGDVDPARQHKMIADLNLSAILLLGTIASIFLGTHLIYQEVERRTVYTVLARPISRGGFLLGKYLGLSAVVGLAIAIMGAFLLAFLALTSWGSTVEVPYLHLALAVAFIYVELAVVIAVALLFSVAAHPIEGAVFAFIVAVTGHVTGNLKDLGAELVRMSQVPAAAAADGGDSAARAALEAGPSALALFGEKALYVLYVLLPNFDNFDLRSEAVWGLPLDAARLLFAVGYAAVYVAILLSLATLVFRRKVL